MIRTEQSTVSDTLRIQAMGVNRGTTFLATCWVPRLTYKLSSCLFQLGQVLRPYDIKVLSHRVVNKTRRTCFLERR